MQPAQVSNWSERQWRSQDAIDLTTTEQTAVRVVCALVVVLVSGSVSVIEGVVAAPLRWRELGFVELVSAALRMHQ